MFADGLHKQYARVDIKRERHSQRNNKQSQT